MRILFDQGTPVPLRPFLTSHKVATAFEQGWSTLLHLVGWTAVNVGILPLIVVAGFMNLALLRRQRSAALPAPA